ncbi:hypothetical protein [Microbacterium oxydans]|uniref:hypothetical protein n=1 Tax=Microbacterium oxydans TaxID=82380 RepID=UPI00226B9050|nr:hypothetical protein [Microbacterium oxydans]WAA66452.1 hypothetical protein MME74_01540 [Microbacterium oxydans]
MNLAQHVRVTQTLHVQLSVADEPALTRTIGVPADAPSYWIVEAYQLSLGIEPEAPELDDMDDPWPLIDLAAWRTRAQCISIPGIAASIEVVVTGPFIARMGEPRVTIVTDGSDGGSAGGDTGGGREEDAGAWPAAGSPDDRASAVGWQTERPAFHAEHVAFELAQRFGLVQPQFSPEVNGDLVSGLRASSPIAVLCESLPPVRRLALLAHLEGSRVLEPTPIDAATAERATAGLRALVARIGPDGVAQDPTDGWLPHDVLRDAVDSLEWARDPGSQCADPAEVLIAFARRVKAIRRLRGRVVVTNLGRSLAAGELRAFPRIVDAVGSAGQEGLFVSGRPREVTLALLALADGTAETFDDLAGAVEFGEAAIALVPGGTWRYSESSTRSYRDRARGPEDPNAVQRLLDGLCALSSPGAYGEITPEIRAVARAALR